MAPQSGLVTHAAASSNESGSDVSATQMAAALASAASGSGGVAGTTQCYDGRRGPRDAEPLPPGRPPARGDERSASALVRLEGVEPEDGAEAEEEGPYLAWLPPDDRLWRHPSERVTEAGPSGSPDGDRGGSGRGRSLPGLFAGWAHHPATRIWAVALVAGIVGAVAASGVGMMTGVFEQQTTVVHSVIPTRPDRDAGISDGIRSGLVVRGRRHRLIRGADPGHLRKRPGDRIGSAARTGKR